MVCYGKRQAACRWRPGGFRSLMTTLTCATGTPVPRPSGDVIPGMAQVVAVADHAGRQAGLAARLTPAFSAAGLGLEFRTHRELAAEVSVEQSPGQPPVVTPDRPLLWLSPGDAACPDSPDGRFLAAETLAAARSIAFLTRSPVLNRPSAVSCAVRCRPDPRAPSAGPATLTPRPSGPNGSPAPGRRTPPPVLATPPVPASSRSTTTRPAAAPTARPPRRPGRSGTAWQAVRAA